MYRHSLSQSDEESIWFYYQCTLIGRPDSDCIVLYNCFAIYSDALLRSVCRSDTFLSGNYTVNITGCGNPREHGVFYCHCRTIKVYAVMWQQVEIFSRHHHSLQRVVEMGVVSFYSTNLADSPTDRGPIVSVGWGEGHNFLLRPVLLTTREGSAFMQSDVFIITSKLQTNFILYSLSINEERICMLRIVSLHKFQTGSGMPKPVWMFFLTVFMSKSKTCSY